MKRSFTITALVILGFLFPLITFSQVDPPEINCPGNKTVSLGTNCQITVDLSEGVSAKGVALANLQYAVSPDLGIMSGTNYPFFGSGIYTVTVSAGRVECSYTISVVDITPPVISCPSNKTIYVNSGQTSAQVTNGYSIFDDCGTLLGPNSYQLQNSLGQSSLAGGGGSSNVFVYLTMTETIPLGHNLITASATDITIPSAGSPNNMGSCSFTIDVVVTGSPCSINCPSNITVDATSPSGAAVDYSVTSNGDCRDLVTIPSAGTIFPVGTTTVKAYGNVSTGLVYGLNHFTIDFPEVIIVDQLITFNVNSANPTAILSTVNITGTSGWEMKAIDFRPSNGQLYGLGVSWLVSASPHYIARLFTINKNTGAATAVNPDYIDLTDAISFDIDFDPVTDKLRVTDGKGTNLRIDPDLGTVIGSDPSLGTGITGTAYTNAFAGSTFTTLYEINYLTNALYVQGGINGVPSQNTGSTTQVGPLGIGASQEFTGFDISPSSVALATFSNKLYSINLATGAATFIGNFSINPLDIAIAPLTLPAASCSFNVTVTPPSPTVTINKAIGQLDPTTTPPVRFTVVFDQDVTGFDVSDISFAGSTVPGTLVATVNGTGSTYEVTVTGITGAGNVVASVVAGAATSNSGQPSLASTSTDNIVAVVVIPHDLRIIKTSTAPGVLPGGLIIYQVTLLCQSQVPLQNVSVTDVLPAGTVFIISTPQSTLPIPPPLVSFPPPNQNGTINILFPVLNPGQVFNFTIQVRALPNATGTISNTITIDGPLGDQDLTNNSSTASVQVLVPPTITCPSNVTVSTGANDCLGLVDVGMLSYIMTGTPAPTLKLTWQLQDNPLTTPINIDVVPGTRDQRVFGLGVNTVTATASNGVLPNATCQFTVTVVDNIPPNITCPSNVRVNTAPGTCTATVSNATIGTATATDNCSATVTISHSAFPSNNVFPRGINNITWTATDGKGNTATCIQTITVVDNEPPSINNVSASPYILWPPNHQMKDVTVNYTSTDNCGVVSCRMEVSSNEPVNDTGDGDTDPDWQVIDDHHVKLRAERAANGEGRIYTITIICSDGQGNETRQTTTVTVAHNITAPNSGQSFKVGSTVSFAGAFWDKPGNKHTAKWLIDGSTTTGTVTEPSGNKNGKVTGSYKFTTPGVYKLQMNVTDQNAVTSYANTNGDLEAIVVIYDPNGGYTYGGGFYNSPAGALIADPSSTGKASYGFTMNYFKNATNPKGETQFEFKIGDFEFNALNFEYLVISNSMAQFKGTGKINGGQSGVAFTMTVTDGQLDGTGIDKIRMKIYNKNNGKIIYDNQPGESDAALPTQAVGASSIIVISGTNEILTSANANPKTAMETGVVEVSNELNVVVYPNPTATRFNININGNAKEKIMMQVVDMYGRTIETRNVTAEQTIKIGDKYRSGTYIVKLIQGENHKELKLGKL